MEAADFSSAAQLTDCPTQQELQQEVHRRPRSPKVIQTELESDFESTLPSPELFCALPGQRQICAVEGVPKDIRTQLFLRHSIDLDEDEGHDLDKLIKYAVAERYHSAETPRL